MTDDLPALTLTDLARNMVNVTGTDPRIQRVTFYVQASGTCDSVPPNLEQISLSPSIVSNAAASEAPNVRRYAAMARALKASLQNSDHDKPSDLMNSAAIGISTMALR